MKLKSWSSTIGTEQSGANQDNFLHCAKANGAAGLLVDFDATSRQYAQASELY